MMSSNIKKNPIIKPLNRFPSFPARYHHMISFFRPWQSKDRGCDSGDWHPFFFRPRWLRLSDRWLSGAAAALRPYGHPRSKVIGGCSDKSSHRPCRHGTQ
eukprot:765830-Hanusia_phi.AAC.1